MRVLLTKLLPGNQDFCGYESNSETCLYVNLRINPKGLDLGSIEQRMTIRVVQKRKALSWG